MRRRPRLPLNNVCATVAATAALAMVVAPPARAETTPALDLLVRQQSTAVFDPALFTFSGEPNTCTAASYALIRDSEVQATTGLDCRITNGRWRSYYEGADPRTYTDASQLGVVQTVPALEAWRSGAQGWSPAQRQNFMEDLGLPAALVVAPVAVVEKRASSDPDAWGPPSTAGTCRYAVEWTQVKYRWDLSVDQREHDRLQRWLSTCGGVAVQVPELGGEGRPDAPNPGGNGSPAGTDRLGYKQVLRSGEWLMSPDRT